MKPPMPCNPYLLILAACAALTVVPIAAGAQSLTAAGGLGLVVEPTDARGRGLGGVALGLPSSSISWTNPAEAVGLPAPGLRVVFQYDQFTSTYGSRSTDGSTARFPLLMGAFPIGDRAAISVGAAGFLDQNYAVESEDTLILGGDSVAIRDRFSSEGGVSQLRLAGGYRVIEGLAVSAGVDMYVGGVDRGFGRLFPGQAAPACCTGSWSYSGFGGVAGAVWRPSPALTVSAATTVGGTLRAEPDDTVSVERSYQIPMRFSLGASGRVANNLLLALATDWGGWSSLDDELADAGHARDSWSARGGVEWDGLVLGSRPLPLRLGGRYATLPFGWSNAGEDGVGTVERALTSGFGLVLAGGAVRTDLAVERGWRGGDQAGIDESFWKFTFSVNALGR
jgi:hypothetical protein